MNETKRRRKQKYKHLNRFLNKKNKNVDNRLLTNKDPAGEGSMVVDDGTGITKLMCHVNGF